MKYMACLVVAAGLSVVVGGGVAVAEEDDDGRIQVSGVGTASAKPDLALASLGVQTFAESVQEAVAENNAAAASVLKALEDAGIESHRIETSSYSVSPRRDHRRDKPDTVIGYWANNSVTVAIADLERVGAILQAAIDAGANNVANLRFTLEDPAPAEEQARIKAVEDARKRAQTLAAAANVELGEVLSIREMSGHIPVFRDQRMMREAAVAESVPIRVDELELTIQVEMVFEID